jgi:hypothetical protein
VGARSVRASAIPDSPGAELADSRNGRVPRSLWFAGLAAVVLAAGGGYAVGRSAGADLDAARVAGERQGRAEGSARGAARGYEGGLRAGREVGYKQTYKGAYDRAYKKALGGG